MYSAGTLSRAPSSYSYELNILEEATEVFIDDCIQHLPATQKGIER